MQTAKATILILICVTLLGACGLRGPLYLPTQNPDSKTNIEQDSTPVAEEEEDEYSGKGIEKKSDSGQ